MKKPNEIKIKGRGSVSRAIRRHKRKEEDPEWYKKQLESRKISAAKRKKRINKRCIDCKKLIEHGSTRCASCASKERNKKDGIKINRS